MAEAFPDNFRHDEMYRGIYATDASIYQQMPLAVLTPKSRGEARRALRIAHKHNVPVLPRAGGTSLAGQTTGEDVLVIDISKHLDDLQEIHEKDMTALVEPGMIRDRLNARIATTGLMFAPETSTSNRANIGGMMMNNSSGMMSIRYGTTISHIEGATAFLADGTELYFGRRSEMDAKGCELLDQLLELVGRNKAPTSPRSSAAAKAPSPSSPPSRFDSSANPSASPPSPSISTTCSPRSAPSRSW
jgi:FAD/FMN-containing dehydrogenase